jgi:hypothetical protein
MDIAGHVSKNMLKHYSHIRMQAKREALESLVTQPQDLKHQKPPSSSNRDTGRCTEATNVKWSWRSVSMSASA